MPTRYSNQYEAKFDGNARVDLRNVVIFSNWKSYTIQMWGDARVTWDRVDAQTWSALRDNATLSWGMGWDAPGRTGELVGLKRKYYADRSWEAGNGRLRLVNTTLDRWWPTTWGDSRLVVRDATLEDPRAYESSTMIIEDSTVNTAGNGVVRGAVGPVAAGPGLAEPSAAR